MQRPETALPLVVVLVGTDHHPFDRLVQWCSDLAAEEWARWFVQFGTSRWPQSTSPLLAGQPMLDVARLNRLLHGASCVVTHAGPGLLMDARLHGHIPVVVPRHPDFGEHIDSHQLRFTEHLAPSGRIRAAHTAAELRAGVLDALSTQRDAQRPAGPAPEVLARFADLVDSAVQRRHPAGRVS